MRQPSPRRWTRLAASFAFAACLLLAGTMLLGGYFESEAYALVPAAGPARPAPDTGALYWSGDMGMRVGIGEGLVDDVAASGIPVLTVSSPMLFAAGRDRAFVEEAVESSVRAALARTHARQLVVIGNSFGADILGAGLGALPQDLRSRIASVILLVPGRDIYFHANPTGIFYRGPTDASPAHTIPLLHGLPVTCIYGADEDDSLCEAPAMSGAQRVQIADGHLMLWSHRPLAQALLRAIANPPRPFV